MHTARRRLSTLAIIPVLVIGLAACATPTGSQSSTGSSSTDSESAPTPGSTSESPTDGPTDSAAGSEPDSGSGASPDGEPVFTAVAPAPRLPVTCAQFLASMPGMTGATVSRTVNGTAQQAALDQVGFIDCELYGSLAGVPVTIRTVVGVEIPRSVVTPRVEAAAAAGQPTDLGGQLSYSDCGFVGSALDCWSGVYANGYFAEINFSRQSWASSAAFDAATLTITSTLAARVAAWGAPPAAWKAPSSALRWATDCESRVASTDSAIVDAIPSSVSSPRDAMPDSGFALSTIGLDRAGFTFCEWPGSLGVTVVIVPGASWRFAQPGALGGTPYPYPGALATFDVLPYWSGYATSSLLLVVDDSLVVVNVGAEYDHPTIPVTQVRSITLDIAQAVIDEFGS